MSFVEGIGTASVDVADPTFAICVTALLLLVGGIAVLPALAAALTYIRTGRLTRFVMDVLRRRRHHS